MKGFNSLTRLFGAALVVGGIASAANAAILVDDQFEYANQAAFEASWAPIGTVAPISGVLSTAQAKSPTKSVQNPGTATTGQYRNQKTFAETSASYPLAPGNSIVWSFDFYDSQPAGAPQRNHNNLQDTTAPSLTNQLVAMGFNNNQTGANSGGQYYMGRILGYTATTVDPDGGPNESVVGSGAFFKLNDFGAPNRSLGWHNLKVVISSDNPAQGHDYAFYVDNVLAEIVSNVGTVVRSYDNIRIGSGLSNGSVESFTDNMQLQTLPEPTSLAAIGLGVLALGARRRRA